MIIQAQHKTVQARISPRPVLSDICERSRDLVHGVEKVIQMSEVKPSHLAEDPV